MATVITNLLSVIPWIGPDFVEFIWGGFSVRNATLNRFYSLHYLLPFVLSALVAMHLLSLHENGSGNPRGVTGNPDRITFNPYYSYKDLVTLFAFFLALSIIVFYYPNVLSHSDNYIPANPMQTPASIVPEWYLLPFYAILRAVTISKMAGVVAMFGSLLILFMMPLLDVSKTRGSATRPIFKVAYWLFVANFFALMTLGAEHVEAPFVLLSQIRTAIYFIWFIIFIPVIGIIENITLKFDN